MTVKAGDLGATPLLGGGTRELGEEEKDGVLMGQVLGTQGFGVVRSHPGEGREALTGNSGEGCRVGGGKASPFPMPTASMLKVSWPRPRPRPPPRPAMLEGAWIFRDPVRKT